MGYTSSVWGRIKMSRAAFDRLSVMTLDGRRLLEIFEQADYDEKDGELQIDSSSKHYDLDAFVDAAAECKDDDRVDIVRYQGEETDDMIAYFIFKGYAVYFLPHSLIDTIHGLMQDRREDFTTHVVSRRLEGGKRSMVLNGETLIGWLKEVWRENDG